MSVYSNNISKEIRSLQDSIKRNNETIAMIKEELLTENNVCSRVAHTGRLLETTINNFDLKIKLEKVKRQIF